MIELNLKDKNKIHYFYIDYKNKEVKDNESCCFR